MTTVHRFIIISICFLLFTIFSISCKEKQTAPSTQDADLITNTIDQWHKAAAETKFDTYFSLMTSDAVFIGTDPTEYWNLNEFKSFCKPYFDKGKAWNFTSLKRHIYLNDDHSMAWFDELLNTQMKICRGSGVLKKEDGTWKIAHYVLSMTIPNDYTKEVVSIKSMFEDKLIDSLQHGNIK